MRVKPITDFDRHKRVDRNAVNVNDIGDFTSVYKFVSLNNPTSWKRMRETIVERKLIGSSPNQLNDPFEGRPHVISDDTESNSRKARIYFSNRNTLVDLNTIDPPSSEDFCNWRIQLDKKLNSTIRNARVLSFCRRADSHLLWAHYADKHRGACLHFSSGSFSGKGVRRGSVEYLHQRPSLFKSLMARIDLPKKDDLHGEERVRLRQELYKSLFFAKPLDWSYEEEFRILYSVSNADHIGIETDGIVEIIVGVNTSETTVKRIQGYIKRSGVDIPLRRAKISEATFGVDIISSETTIRS